MKTLTWQKPGQHFVAQELIKIIINYVAELRVVLKLILFVGLLILLWNVYVALRIYIKKNSDVKWKEKDRLVNVSLLLILSRKVLPGYS